MFPGVDGFRWDLGHVIFLGAFFSLLAIVGVTVMRAFARAWRSRRPALADAIRWRADFADLPECDRHCRHEITGEVRVRLCPNEFDCRRCAQHPVFEAQRSPAAGAGDETGRLYHRGHTWARAESDGTYTIGLDEIGTWVMGHADRVELPAAGTVLKTNGVGWYIDSGRERLRVLAPIDGTVVETANGENGWYLRLQPAAGLNTAHLLRGWEARAWKGKEIERLQMALGAGQPALADGGTLEGSLETEYPEADWDAVRGDMLLQP
jgi:glycine cleavage system H lipoate-binding protein